MLQRVRKHMNPATAIAFLALVFALTGGAFAATGGGGSPSHATLTASVAKSNAKAKTKAGPRGPAGPKGATGAAGPTGPAGSAGATGPGGAQGPQGPAGNNGENGKAGAPGANGTNGETPKIEQLTGSSSECNKEGGVKVSTKTTNGTACNGSPWTAGGTLPAGKTETGLWAINGGPGAGSTYHAALASFAIPLAERPTLNVIGPQEGEGQAKENEKAIKENEARKLNGEPEVPLPIPTYCKGNAKNPEAVEGNVCVFEFISNNVGTLETIGVETTGVLAKPEVLNESAFFYADGSWAVTAK